MDLTGFRLLPGHLDRAAQGALMADIADVIRAAPLYTPVMPRSGRPFSVRMTNCGPLGWVSDRDGYRYQPARPETGEAWPAMPASVVRLWDALSDYPHRPEACLINWYGLGTRMGLHRDEDEEAIDAPVVSLSLGDTAVFRLGGLARKGATRSFRLASGDALVLGGDARLAFHGVDRILAGSSTLLAGYPDLCPDGGRINLTLRRVTVPLK